MTHCYGMGDEQHEMGGIVEYFMTHVTKGWMEKGGGRRKGVNGNKSEGGSGSEIF